jgi:hypothetical protein
MNGPREMIDWFQLKMNTFRPPQSVMTLDVSIKQFISFINQGMYRFFVF